jgi:hypothetical protein
MRTAWLSALGGLLLAVSTACPEEVAQPTAEAPVANVRANKPASVEASSESDLTFGHGLPAQIPWSPPPLPSTAPNHPAVPLPYFSPPAVGPSPEELARIPGGSRFWGGFEYLMWWEKKAPLPSDFVTTGSVRDAVPGALGQPNTHIFYTSPVVDFYQIQGLRVTAGAWFDHQQLLGLEASGFLMEKRTHVFQARSDSLGNPLLAFAHFDPLPKGSADAFVASEPRGGKMGPFAGGLGFDTDTQLWGTEANLIHALYWSRLARASAGGLPLSGPRRPPRFLLQAGDGRHLHGPLPRPIVPD